MRNLEFHFIDEEGYEVDAWCADWLVAWFDCLQCGYGLRFQKPYEQEPLHYESLLRRCDDVKCPKCGTDHRHTTDDGEDVVVTVESTMPAPNQLSLFTR